MDNKNPNGKAKRKSKEAKKDKPKRYKKVIIPAYGAAAASEKYVTDDSEDDSGRPAPKAKKAKKATKVPKAAAAAARQRSDAGDSDGDGGEDSAGEVTGGVESPVLPHGAYRHRMGKPPRDEDDEHPPSLYSDDEESDEDSERTKDSDSGSESDTEPTVRKVF